MFNRRKAEEWEVVGKARSYWEEFSLYHRQEKSEREPDLVTWRRPPPGWVKVNVDAAVLKGEGTGMGMIIRDSEGVFLRAAVRRERKCWPPEIAEIKAVEFGLKHLEMSGHRQAVVETDCQQVVHALRSKSQTRLEAGPLISEMQATAQRLGSIRWDFVKRNGNEPAHTMAHTRCNWEEEECWDTRPPIVILNSLEKEARAS
ncbi:unnamed protein product [Linum trigynum]|uniref:RNase H type-1 domain-containing protein n=1 Tax=Linum trigynum TaxID=586398 RepID=A0AAV2FCD4_9ROSI